LSRSRAVPQLSGVPTLSSGSSATTMSGALNAPRLGYPVSSYVAASPPVSSYVAQAPMAPRALRAPMTTAVNANQLFQGLANEFDRVDTNKNGVIERKEWDKVVTKEAKLAHEASLESSQGTVETAATDAKVPPAVYYVAPEETAPVEKPCCSVPVEAPVEKSCCSVPVEVPVAEKPAAQKPTEMPAAVVAKQETSCFAAMCAFLPCS